MRTGTIKSSELAQMSSWVAGDVLDCQKTCDICGGHGYREDDQGGECQNCDGRGYVFVIPDPKAHTIGEVMYAAVREFSDRRAAANGQNGWASMSPVQRESYEAAARFMLGFLEASDAIEVRGYAERYPLQTGLLNEREQTDMLRQHEQGLSEFSKSIATSAQAILALHEWSKKVEDRLIDLEHGQERLVRMSHDHTSPD